MRVRVPSAAVLIALSCVAPPSHGAGEPDSVFATIGTRAITREEVDRRAAAALQRVRREEYEARRQALDAIVEDEVLGLEAAKKKTTREALLAAEVESKLPVATPAEIDRYYTENRGRMGGKPKEQVEAQIVAALQGEKRAIAKGEFVRALRKKYGVRLALEPPRVDVATGDSPSLGAARAPVTIVEFSDYQCPFCSRAAQTVEQVVERYGDRVRLVYRDFPLGIHPNAEPAARAAACARAQGKYWEMNRALFADASKLAAPDLVETARRLGLDAERFQACFDSGDTKAAVQQDVKDGERYGVTGTPTFFINGIMIVGARELRAFTDIIDDELERTGR